MEGYEVGDSIHGYRIRAEARRSAIHRLSQRPAGTRHNA